ncbi:nuclear receptor coactivator 1-like isoform X1 [Cydia strobilella]|uniref:nuclear receptor coactivator 1-like isoform X1 n=1 Tax=Cydia strobilella TaxID=1100964 RepID=UPI003007107D
MLPMVHTEPVFFDFGGPSIDGAATPSPSVPSSLTPHSDVDELVDIFFDVDVAVNTFSRVDSCDLQLGDTWRGMQGKMSVTAPVKKIKRKSDSKPQSQVNKCINEKRRRELENETINQLEELLGTCLAEVKQPDKNGIVREATRQIQEVLNRRRECPGECPLRARLEPVQAGEVSSTQPQPPPPGHHYSETTTLIEALKHYTSSLGWVLLEINSEGKIVCVTENIKDFILQDRTELYKKSIFSLLHARDHAKIKPLLKNIQSFGWSAGDTDKFQAIQARLAIHNSNGTDNAEYVEAVIHAAPVRGSPAEQAGSVMCVIRRCEDASALLPAPLPTDGPPSRADIHNDQIVFRLDSNLVILTCDLSGVEDLVGTRYLELIDQSDRVRVAAHLKGAPGLSAPPSISDPFRLRLNERRLRVIAQTRIFRADAASDEHDFIMSTHTVLDDDAPQDAGPAPSGAGGPLLPSAPNGEPYRPTMSPAEFIAINDFDHDQWFSVPNFPMGDMSEESKETKGSPSPGPLTPLTPRTPATPGDATSTPVGPAGPADERLRSLLTKPVSEASSVASENRLLKNLLKQEEEDGTSSETSAPHTPLTPHTPHTPAALSPHHSHTGGARALPHNPHAPHAPHASHMLQSQMSMSSAALHTLQPPINNGSEILSRILHTNSDEDAEENRRNCQDGNRPSQVSHPSALLTQLLANGPSNNGRTTDPERDYLHERLQGVKRKFEENKGCPTSNVKRPTSEAQQVSSSAVSASPTCSSSATSPPTSSAGMSPLCAKNQILVSLLARQQTSPTTPMPLPNALRGFPAQRPRAPPPPLPRHQATITNMLAANNNNRPNSVNGGSGGSGLECAPSLGQSHLQLVLQGAPRGYPAPASNPPPDPLHYGNTAPLHVYNNQPISGSSRQGDRGDSEVPCGDSMLSAILDEFIENMPDADRNAPDGMKDSKAMINAIRQSLMQCETVTKSPVSTSPGPPPPVYSVQNLGGGSMSGSNAAMYSMSGAGVEPARRVGDQQQQKARLLQQQLQQQMLVSREVSSVSHYRAGSMSGSNAAMYSMSGAGVEPARRVGDQQQQKARLLQQQLQQQMLVSREVSSVSHYRAGSMSGSNAAMYSMSGAGVEPARRVGDQQQQKARLLQQQLQQQMLVSREVSSVSHYRAGSMSGSNAAMYSAGVEPARRVGDQQQQKARLL